MLTAAAAEAEAVAVPNAVAILHRKSYKFKNQNTRKTKWRGGRKNMVFVGGGGGYDSGNCGRGKCVLCVFYRRVGERQRQRQRKRKRKRKSRRERSVLLLGRVWSREFFGGSVRDEEIGRAHV